MTLRPLALVASLVAGLAGSAFATAAVAQSAPAPQVAAQPGHRAARPAPVAAQAAGTVARYVVGPTGRVRGFVLADGTVVMMRGRAAQAMAQAVPVGQSVRVEGFTRAGGARMIHRATVTASNGAVFAPPARAARGPDAGEADGGPRRRHGRGDRAARRAAMQARIAQLGTFATNSTVQGVIAGRRGAPRALLMADGTTVYLPRPMVVALRDRGVRVGEAVRASGRGGAHPHGGALVAEQLTLADGTTLRANLSAAAPSR